MQVEPSLAGSIFQSALAQIHTPWGISWAVVLVNAIVAVGWRALQRAELHWWAFAGAVLSTILVDSLFFIAASIS
jgi:hypothetical protein